MSNKSDKIVGNFHIPSSNQHPSSSLGNQQIWDKGRQVGSIEYTPNPLTGNLDLSINNIKGTKITDL